MKAYSQFLKELPSKKIVFAFGRFQPPTTGHELLVRAVERLASTHNASHVIYASRTQDKTKNPLPVDRKVYYLKRMFPTAKFMAAGPSTRTFIEVAKELNKKYKDIIMVAGSDRVVEYTKLLNQYNGKEFNFNTIQVVSAGERDPDSDDATGMSGTKMREAAKKGDFDTFKKGLPTTLTTMDGRRLMNEIRQAMGLDVVKEQVTVTDWLRESYHRGEIFKVGQIVESNGERYEILDRGSNYLTVVDTSGNTHRKWLHNVTVVEDYQETEDTSDFSYKNYKPQNIKHPQVIAAFSRLTSRDDVDPVAVLNALKSTDEYHSILNKAVEYDEISEEEVDQFNSSIQMAQEYLMKLGELHHHADYINHAIHDIDQVRAQYHMEKEEGMEESMKTFKELIEMKFSSSDKIKVARIIADALGVPDVEKSSSADQLVNNALRKIRNKPMRPEYMSVLKNMLQTAREAGINYDEKLVPGKIEEGYDEIETSDTKLDKRGRKIRAHTLRFKNSEKEDDKEEVKEGLKPEHNMRPGWMIKGDPELAAKLKKSKEILKARKAAYGNPAAGKSVKEETELDESHVEFRIDHRQKVTPGHEKTFKDHDAKVSEISDKATYVKVPADKANAFKAAMKSKHNTHLELAEEFELIDNALNALEEAISTIDKGEYDYEGAMARTQLQTVVRNSQELINMLSMDDNMPEWVQSKITLAQDYISSVRDYLKSREELGEATAYYNKPSFLKKMSRIAKQERQAREKKEAEQKKQVKEESSSVYDNHIKGHSDYGSIVKKHGVIKTKQIIRHLKTERESMRKSDWAGPAHLKKHDYAIRGLSRALGEEKIEYEEHEQSTYDDSKFVVGDTGKLTYDAMKRFLGIQNVSDLENLKNKSSFTMAQKRYMHEETEEENFDEEDFDDDITSMSEPEHIIDAYDDEEFAIVDDESGEELDTDGYEEEDKEEEAKIKEGKIIILEISRMERIRRKQRFARTKSKREVRAQIALRRTSNQTTINKRARRLATAMIKRRLLRKDPNKATLPEKERVERFLQTRKALVDRLSRRVAPRIRQIEKSRLQHKKFTK
jgi:hypothetical protein